MKRLFDALEELDNAFRKEPPSTFNYLAEQIRWEFGFKTRNDVVEYYLEWIKAGA